MARFTSPATWGRSKQQHSSSAYINGSGSSGSTRDLNSPMSTASLNQSSSYDTHYQHRYEKGLPSALAGSANSAAVGGGMGHHPYAANPPAPTPIVSQDPVEPDEVCPVCLESLSFSFRLPGEKPHIVPECGHALHEACYSHVYGPIVRGGPRKSHVGVCGVCRRPMKVGDGDSSKTNKLAALTGMGSVEDRNTPIPTALTAATPQLTGASSTPGIVGPSNASTISGLSSPTSPPPSANPLANSRTAQLIDAHPHTGGGPQYVGVPPPPPSKRFDPTEDDPLDNTSHSVRSGTSSGDMHGASAYVVAPSIQVRSEFPTVTPHGNGLGATNGGGTHPLTCIVVVELPSRRSGPLPQALSMTVDPTMFATSPPPPPAVEFGGATLQQRHGTTKRRPGPDQSPHHHHQLASPPSNHNSPPQLPSPVLAAAPPPVVEDPTLSDAPNPAFESIALDLRNRIADWKGHPMEGLGALQKFDILSVKRDTLVREFLVYLFKEAIICVLEDKKKTTGTLSSDGNGTGKPVLRLKGRIYIRHIKRVQDTSTMSPTGPELSLTIEMEDERLDSFILIFKDRVTLEGWRGVVSRLVQDVRDREKGITSPPASNVNGIPVAAPVPVEHVGPTHTVTGRPRAGTNTSGPPPGTTLPAPPPHQQLLGDMDEFGVQVRQAKQNQTMATVKGPRAMSGGSSAMDTTTASRTTSSSAVDGYDEHGVTNGAVRNPHRGTMSSTATSAAASNSSYYAKVPDPTQHPGEHHHGHHQQYSAHSQQMLNMMSPTPTAVVPHASNATPSNSLPPIPHTPMDLILVISLPSPTSHPSTAELKLRVIKATMDFVLGSLGIRDRLSIVTFEVGVGGRVRKTPFLRLGRAMGRERLERFVDTMSFGGYDAGAADDAGSTNGTITGVPTGDGDEFLIRTGREEKTDVVTGVNHALDTVLQRKAKNSISGMLLVSDASDSTRRAQMDLVLARAEAANLPIHSFGYGRSHDPACLWLMSNHTNGTYTFVKDWYDLRPCLAGCIGGMMSIGLLNMKLHMKILDTHRFRIRKVSGGPHAIVSSEGKDVDVEIGEVRYGERKEMLVELELDHFGGGPSNGRMTPGAGPAFANGNGRGTNATDQFVARMGLDALSISGDASPNLMDGMMDRMIDDVPVFEVDGSFFDPAAAKHVSRLAHPVLLTVTIIPPSSSTRPNTPNTEKPSDPVIVRRRMELLASDMVTRALVLISRKNYEQAQRIMSETRRILNTVLQAVGSGLSEPGSRTVRSRKELLTLSAIRALQSVLQDVQVLTDAMEDSPEMFAHDHRNLGAQQAMILRDQKSWSGRTPIEQLFWTADSSIDLVQRSNDWVSVRD